MSLICVYEICEKLPQQYNRKIFLTQTLLRVLLTPNINKHSVQWNLQNESVFGRRK